MRLTPIRTLAVLLPFALGALACSQAEKKTETAAAAAKPAAQTEEEKTLYALGVVLSRNLQSFEFTAKELDTVAAGMKEGALQKKSVDEYQSYIPKLQELQRTRQGAAASKVKEAGAAYVTKAAGEPGATKTTSGLVIKTTKEGTGASPKATDEVKVHYEGRFIDGKVFDSSIARGEPASFELTGVIPCWTEAVQLMKVGGKATVVCPSDLAYGDAGRGEQMPGGATLVFDIELLGVGKAAAAAAPKAPK